MTKAKATKEVVAQNKAAASSTVDVERDEAMVKLIREYAVDFKARHADKFTGMANSTAECFRCLTDAASHLAAHVRGE